MATPSNSIVYEVRATGNATNGGGFKTGATGTDWSKQDAVKYALTLLTSSGAGNVVLSSSAAADWVGNVAHCISGTNFTAGFFEITSVSVGVSFTCSTNQAGIAITTGVGATGVVNIGGALNLGAASDATFAAGIAPGNVVYIKAGAYTPGASMSFTDGVAQNSGSVIGYQTVRGDNPQGANRPMIYMVAHQWTAGAFQTTSNLYIEGSGTFVVTSDGQATWNNCTVKNTSTTAGRSAMLIGSDDLVFGCEIISYLGNALSLSGDICAYGCYIHDSAIGIKQGSNNVTTVNSCIFAGNFTSAILFNAANSSECFLSDNTFYGAENKLGTGLFLNAASTDVRSANNIYYGLAMGVMAATTVPSFSAYNAYSNNTANFTLWPMGYNDYTNIAPQFSSVTLLSGTATGFSNGGAAFADSTANFLGNGVTPGQDYVFISAGTSLTPGVYGISAVATNVLTISSSPGSAATGIVYQVRIGENFNAAGVSGIGYPGAFPGSKTTGFNSIGAVANPGSGGGGMQNTRVGGGP